MTTPLLGRQFQDGFAASLVAFPVVLVIGYFLGLFEGCLFFNKLYLVCIHDLMSTTRFFTLVTPVCFGTAFFLSLSEGRSHRGLLLVTFLSANFFVLAEYALGIHRLVPGFNFEYGLPKLVIDILWISLSVTIGAILGYRIYKWIQSRLF